jgi:molybdopterin converting factor small subunit
VRADAPDRPDLAPIEVRLPPAWRRSADGETVVRVAGPTVGAALRALVARHSQLERQVFSPGGGLRPSALVYVNGRDIRELDRDSTPLSPGDRIEIIAALAGG